MLGYNDVSKQLVSHFISHTANISVKGYFEDYKSVHELSNFPDYRHLRDCLHYANIQQGDGNILYDSP
jgi:hypothetical protein